jgi:hypothetical protein
MEDGSGRGRRVMEKRETGKGDSAGALLQLLWKVQS